MLRQKRLQQKLSLQRSSIKRIAMTKESKKRGQANNSLIEQWRYEIEALPLRRSGL